MTMVFAGAKESVHNIAQSSDVYGIVRIVTFAVGASVGRGEVSKFLKMFVHTLLFKVYPYGCILRRLYMVIP